MDLLRHTLDAVLSNDFRIERELGGGGMSRVFLAEDLALHRQVVIKVLPPELAASVSQERFRREIQVAAQLQHPHIVPVHSAGAADDLLYFVMPFVEGSSLRERLGRGALPPADAIRIWREVLDGLAYAHAAGVVHRDIKPENILLSGRHASITDFGVANAMQAASGEERVTVTGTVLGTPAYMAPEQAAADSTIDHRVDLYAAGLVMYEMLAGAPPFSGRNARELLIAHITQDPPPLAQVQPLVPAPLSALVMRCLAKDPRDRPDNAEAVLAELDQVASPSTPSPMAGVQPVRRRRILPLVAAIILVIAAAAAWGAKTGAFGLGGVAPPAQDSLRLVVGVASLRFDPADSTLALRVRDAALAELGKDPWLRIITPAMVAQVAAPLGMAPQVLANPDTLRGLFKKTRTNVILDFGVSRASSGYVLTVEAQGAKTDTSLGVISEAAAGAADLPRAMARLGETLRARIVAARAHLPPTAFSYTAMEVRPEAMAPFLEAQKFYNQRQWLEAARLFGEAVRIDSTFADAWLLRYWSLRGAGVSRKDQLDALAAAYRLRDRIRSPVARYELAAQYARARQEWAVAIAFYDSIARLTPNTGGRGNYNVGSLYAQQRQFDVAARIFRSLIDTTYKSVSSANSSLVLSLLNAGRLADARAEVARMVAQQPASALTANVRYLLATATRDWNEYERSATARLAAARSTGDSLQALQWLRGAAIVRGKLTAFDTLAAARSRQLKASGSGGDYLEAEAQRARFHALLGGDTARARAIVDSALNIVSWESLPTLDRPHREMILFAASVRDAKRGAAVLRDWRENYPAEFRTADSLDFPGARAALAVAAGDGREALRLLTLLGKGERSPSSYPDYARAFDLMGQKDSALVYFEKYANTRSEVNPVGDAIDLPPTFLRLGELYEDKHNRKAAIDWYTRFIDHLSATDVPLLQAKVRDVRQRVARLQKRSG